MYKKVQVVNLDDYNEFIKVLTDKRHPSIVAWAQTKILRHLDTHPMLKEMIIPLFDEKETSSRLFKHVLDVKEVTTFQVSVGGSKLQARAFMSRNIFSVLDFRRLPSWVTRAYNEEDRLVIFAPSMSGRERPFNQLRHWLDFLEAEFEDQLKADQNYLIRTSVTDMERLVRSWDRKLERQKLQASLTKDITKLEAPNLKELGFELYELKSADARKAEGSAMRHCVGNAYYGQEHNKILSVRRAPDDPVYTVQLISVLRGIGDYYYRLGQVSGRFNGPVPEDVKSALVEDLSTLFPMEKRTKYIDVDDRRLRPYYQQYIWSDLPPRMPDVIVIDSVPIQTMSFGTNDRPLVFEDIARSHRQALPDSTLPVNFVPSYLREVIKDPEVNHMKRWSANPFVVNRARKYG